MNLAHGREPRRINSLSITGLNDGLTLNRVKMDYRIFLVEPKDRPIRTNSDLSLAVTTIKQKLVARSVLLQVGRCTSFRNSRGFVFCVEQGRGVVPDRSNGFPIALRTRNGVLNFLRIRVAFDLTCRLVGKNE